MPTHSQITVEPADNGASSAGGDLGKANYAALNAMFVTAPYNADYTKEAVKRLGQELLLNGTVNDGGHTFGTLNRDYTDAPDYADVEVGGAGLPASAWVPNPSSPTDGVNNPGSIPAAPDGYGTTPADNWGGGVGSQLSPAASSAQISAQKFGQLATNRSSS